MHGFKEISGPVLTALLGAFLAAVVPLHAVQIPLDGVPQVTHDGKKASSDKIAFVDIEVLFHEHPLKKRLQDEFLAEAEKRKKAIAEREKAIQEFEEVIASSTTEANRLRAELNMLQPGAAPLPARPQAAPLRMLLPGTTEAVPVHPSMGLAATSVVQSTAPAANPEAVAARQKELQEKEAGIDTMKQELRRMKDDLAARVKADKADLLSLEEKQSSQVLADLYGLLEKIAREQSLTIILNKNDVLYGQPYQDITQEVLKRLQGR